jgi:hypothetical protein
VIHKLSFLFYAKATPLALDFDNAVGETGAQYIWSKSDIRLAGLSRDCFHQTAPH